MIRVESYKDFYDYNNKDRKLVVSLAGKYVNLDSSDILGNITVGICKDDAIKLAKYLLDITGTNIYHESIKILAENDHRLVKEGIWLK